MIEELKQNIETEIEVLREISNNLRRMDYANPSERKLLSASTESLKASLKIINNSIPRMLEDITIVKKLPRKEKETKLEKVEVQRIESTIHVTLKEEDRENFLKQLSISENLIRKLKRRQNIVKEKSDEIKAARGYIKLSNKFFLKTSLDLINKGHFKQLSVELKKANINVLFAAYVAMMLLSTLLVFFISIIFTVLLMFFSISFSAPFITMDGVLTLTRLMRIIWIPFATPLVVFFILYYYPSTEKDSIAKKIDQELPFAVIHMSSISGSGIAPSEIFKIIGLSKEYPYLRKEIRKVLNQINLYGYDLVNALSNVSKSTPSKNLAELFGGLATTITSGGNLSEFFEKRSESLLVSYRLDREKYTKIAEAFMDIYISLVIAAPMILMVLLVLISISNIKTGYSINELSFFIIIIIALLNFIFLTFLQFKQPKY